MLNKISFDLNTINRDVSNQTVGQVRAALSDALNIAPGAEAKLNGNVATDDQVIGAGETLTFTKKAGEKGC